MKFIPLLLALSFALNGPAWAQSDDLKSASESAASGSESDGSMNSLWSDEAKPAGTTENSAVSTPTSVQPPAGAETTVTDVSGLCSMNAFQSSELLSRSAWPGLGPFSSGGENQFVDPQDNKLKLFVDGDHITACELFLSNSGTANQNFLNLEMVCDFMLEALGAKSSKIADFNSYLEKNKDALGGALSSAKKAAPVQAGLEAKYAALTQAQLFAAAKAHENGTTRLSEDEYQSLLRVYGRKVAKSSGASATNNDGLKTTAGAYAVALFPATQGPGTLLIQVTSKNGKISKTESIAYAQTAHDVEPDAGPDAGQNQTTDVPAKTTVIAAANNTKTPAKTVKPTNVKTPANVKTQAEVKGVDVKGVEVKGEDSEGTDPLKNELRDVIRNWQTVKKAAVKTRDTSALSTVLSGNALKRQQDSIKWLVDNKQHYELTPKSVTVEKYEEISKAPKKYAVFTIVKELTKVMKDGVAGAAKETDDTYSVKYTIERTGDHWSIADSLLLVKKK